MRIGVDVRYLSRGLTGGVRTYVFHLARWMPRVAPAHQFFYYVDAKATAELSDIPSNVTVRTMPWRSRMSTVVNDQRIGSWMSRDRVDVAHFPANYGPSGRYTLVLTLHDALNLFPQKEHWRGFGKTPTKVAMMMYLGFKTRRTLARAHTVITVSEHARHAIAECGRYPVDRIHTIYEAADDVFLRIDDEARISAFRSERQLNQEFLLADGVKNPAAVLDAYRALPQTLRERANLVFFSREGAPRPEVATAMATEPGIRFISRPATSDLVLLMNLARAFVFPSWYEGFGLPLVEAMQCGAPIIASSRGSIPEVAGEAGLIFDLEEPEALLAHLRSVLEDDALRARMAARSLERAAFFSWSKAARQTVDVYERAREGSSSRPSRRVRVSASA